MVGWFHQFNGYEFEQTPGESEEKREECARRGPSGCKKLDMTERLNNNCR